LALSGRPHAEHFGSGKHLSLQPTPAKIRNIGLSYTDPYAMVGFASRGFDPYDRRVDAFRWVWASTPRTPRRRGALWRAAD
jgi:hypothetical protein